NVHNVECIWGDIEKVGGTKIKDRIVDVVIASNILFQVEHRDKFIEEAKRILKPGGRVLLIDWSDTSSSIGPNFNTMIPKNKAREMFERTGFVFEREIDAGAHHYGMILVKH
ncbi:class I SAM-dependent methyltransferase, partial [Candidatus Nomurabacteria bacterium]|nr:class I SAM-dependent methyltransferase [Candidatus Nomurabacteria bacterium]